MRHRGLLIVMVLALAGCSQQAVESPPAAASSSAVAEPAAAAGNVRVPKLRGKDFAAATNILADLGFKWTWDETKYPDPDGYQIVGTWPDSGTMSPAGSTIELTLVKKSKPAPAAFSGVLYEVEGTAKSVSLTMETPTGTEQVARTGVPLKNEGGGTGLEMNFDPGEFVYISAQNLGESGTVTCRITSNGVVISENTSTGAYVIAQCDGSA